ncbi:MAG: riboflavin synthase [Planctomycetota bacterium]|nr:riboflavin synthase [Planctomycetota bacterium]
MFTGLIEHIGGVLSVSGTAAGKRLRIDLGPLAAECKLGDSVAVDGVCLTVADMDGTAAEFDAVPETLQRTTLGLLRASARVNLELPIRHGKPFGGHFVLGHVDGVGQVDAIESAGREYLVHIAFGPVLEPLMVEKGSVAIDGISLTIARLRPGVLTVAIIPTTLAKTTMRLKKAGDKVNIECDILGKYVLKALAPWRTSAPVAPAEQADRSERPTTLSEDTLKAWGF